MTRSSFVAGARLLRAGVTFCLMGLLVGSTAAAQSSCDVPDELRSPPTCDGKGGWISAPASLPPPDDQAIYAATRGYDFAGGCGGGAVWAFFKTPHCRGGNRNGQPCDPLCAQGVRDEVRTSDYCSGGCESGSSSCNPANDLRCDTDGGQD